MRALGKSFGNTVALRELTLDIRAGEVFGLLGPNGAGKTTTLRLIAGLLRPTQGEVHVLGHKPEEARLRRLIGMQSETTGLYPRLTVKENLVFLADLYGLDRVAARRRLGELVETMGLGDFVDRRVGRLSTGQRKRAALAQALLASPPILLLDEPWTGLDPASARALRLHITGLARETGVSVVLSTHGLADAAEICDRVGILAHGTLRALGPPEGLRAPGTSDGGRPLPGGEADAFRVRVEFLVPERCDPGCAAWLEKLSPGASSRGALEIDAGSAEALAGLVKEAVERGLGVVGVRRLGPNLEDVYMEVIADDKVAC